MSYNKTNWASGDVITAEKLNNIEEGIEDVEESAILISCTQDSGTITADMTFAEIHNAIENGKVILLKCRNNSVPAGYLIFMVPSYITPDTIIFSGVAPTFTSNDIAGYGLSAITFTVNGDITYSYKAYTD